MGTIHGYSAFGIACKMNKSAGSTKNTNLLHWVFTNSTQFIGKIVSEKITLIGGSVNESRIMQLSGL